MDSLIYVFFFKFKIVFCGVLEIQADPLKFLKMMNKQLKVLYEFLA